MISLLKNSLSIISSENSEGVSIYPESWIALHGPCPFQVHFRPPNSTGSRSKSTKVKAETLATVSMMPGADPPGQHNFWNGKNDTTYVLVAGRPTPLKKYESQLGWPFPMYGKIKHVPNHHWTMINPWTNSVKPGDKSRWAMMNHEKPRTVGSVLQDHEPLKTLENNYCACFLSVLPFSCVCPKEPPKWPSSDTDHAKWSKMRAWETAFLLGVWARCFTCVLFFIEKNT